MVKKETTKSFVVTFPRTRGINLSILSDDFTLIESLVVAIIATLATMLFPMFSRSRNKARSRREVLAMRQKKIGFTLIELLVVIAVIAVLAAILFPVFSQARRRALLARCLSETRQIGQAVLMYAQDYDEMMPPVQNFYNPDANWGFIALGPYLRNDQVWDCPVCDPLAEGYVSIRFRVSIDKRLNDWMSWTCRSGSSQCVFRTKSLAHCMSPVLFFVVSDRHWLGTHHVVADSQTERLIAVAPMAFADGHIKAVRIYSAYDRMNWPIPYHWDFPNCHWATDPLLVEDYSRYGGL